MELHSVDHDQAAPLGAVLSGSALFAQTYTSENLGSLRYCDHVKQFLQKVEEQMQTYTVRKQSLWYLSLVCTSLANTLYICLLVPSSNCTKFRKADSPLKFYNAKFDTYTCTIKIMWCKISPVTFYLSFLII